MYGRGLKLIWPSVQIKGINKNPIEIVQLNFHNTNQHIDLAGYLYSKLTKM
jgi:hypothetical protein